MTEPCKFVRHMHTHLSYLGGHILDVPERGFQASLGQQRVLYALQEQEEGWNVREEQGRGSYSIIAYQNHFSRTTCSNI